MNQILEFLKPHTANDGSFTFLLLIIKKGLDLFSVKLLIAALFQWMAFINNI